MVRGDLDAVMRLHRHFFPTNVFGRLGPRVLRTYYGTLVDGAATHCRVATSSGEVKAYLVGVLDVSAHGRDRRSRHRRQLILAGVTALLRHPVLVSVLVTGRVRRAARAWAGGRGGRDGGGAPAPRRLAVLSHVGVVASSRGRGVGDRLIKDFVRAAGAAGAEAVTLATLEGPAGAGPYYERAGWTMVQRSRTADGRAIRVYELPASLSGGNLA